MQKMESKLQEPHILSAPPISQSQPEKPTEQKKGMTLAGVGESAVGTAGMLLLKDQLFDKDHRNQLQHQMSQLLQQQAWISKQIFEIKQKIDQLSNGKEGSSWGKKLLM